MSPERKLDAWSAQWAVQALARWMLTVATALGVLIVVGGRVRWSSPAYADALRVPGAPESWGIALLILGVAGICCSLSGWLRCVATCLFLNAAWYAFFTFSLFTVAQRTPTSGTTGIGIYIGACVTSGVLAVVHWRSYAGKR